MSDWTLSAAEKAVENGHVSVREAVVLTGRALLVQAVENVKSYHLERTPLEWERGYRSGADAVLRQFDILTGTTDQEAASIECSLCERQWPSDSEQAASIRDIGHCIVCEIGFRGGTTDRSEGE